MTTIFKNQFWVQDAAQEVPPFWRKLCRFFLFPLKKKPLAYGVSLSFFSYGIGLALSFNSIIAIILAAGLTLAVVSYGFKLSALASQGIAHKVDIVDYRFIQKDNEWKWLPWKYFGVLFLSGIFIGLLGELNAALGILASIFVSFLIPAIWMVLIGTQSLRVAASPVELLATVRGIGMPYLLLGLFLFLLQLGTSSVIELVSEAVSGSAQLSLLIFVLIYFSWVVAAMIGDAMYQYHSVFGIDVLTASSPAQAEQSVDAVDQETKQRDDLIAQLVQNHQIDEAVVAAQQWLGESYRSLSDYQRCFQVLKLTDRSEELVHVGRRLIPMLIAQQRFDEALDAWASCCFKASPNFQLDLDQTVFDLANYALKVGQPKYVLILAKEFASRYHGSSLIAPMKGLSIKAYKIGLNQPLHAVRIYLELKQRFPDHPSTQSAQRLLRDDLQILSTPKVES